MAGKEPRTLTSVSLEGLGKKALQASFRPGAIRLRLVPQIYDPAARLFKGIRGGAVLVTVGSIREMKRVLRVVRDAVEGEGNEVRNGQKGF